MHAASAATDARIHRCPVTCCNSIQRRRGRKASAADRARAAEKRNQAAAIRSAGTGAGVEPYSTHDRPAKIGRTIVCTARAFREIGAYGILPASAISVSLCFSQAKVTKSAEKPITKRKAQAPKR